MALAVESSGPGLALVVGIGLLIAAWLNFRFSDWIIRAPWGGKPDPKHARRMHDSPFGSRIGGSIFLAVSGAAIVLTALARLL